MDILRISTAGSVDDGKSTLIGRLLYDTRSLPKDKIENIERISKQRGLSDVDLSLITDGLTAEREQGITIDVAHIYFNTKHRKYIIGDTPGHIEYTRNMVTGASNANVFVILIDARNGILEQTKRHLFIASLMEIKEIVFVINKIDLVGYEEKVYVQILAEIQKLVAKFGLADRNLTYIPVSAKHGDNVVARSSNFNWYDGPTLIEFLETVQLTSIGDDKSRFTVQYVIRPHSNEFHDFRGYAGKVKSGSFEVGQEVLALPSGQKAKIKAINKFKKALLQAGRDESVTIELETDIDISRGDILVPATEVFQGDRELNARLCWLSKEALSTDRKYLLQYGATTTPVKISDVSGKLNFDTLDFETDSTDVSANAIAKVNIRSASPVFLDRFTENPSNGSFVLIDETANTTIAVGFRN